MNLIHGHVAVSAVSGFLDLGLFNRRFGLGHLGLGGLFGFDRLRILSLNDRRGFGLGLFGLHRLGRAFDSLGLGSSVTHRERHFLVETGLGLFDGQMLDVE